VEFSGDLAPVMRKKRQEHTTAIGSHALSAITAPADVRNSTYARRNQPVAPDPLKFNLHRD